MLIKNQRNLDFIDNFILLQHTRYTRKIEIRKSFEELLANYPIATEYDRLHMFFYDLKLKELFFKKIKISAVIVPRRCTGSSQFKIKLYGYTDNPHPHISFAQKHYCDGYYVRNALDDCDFCMAYELCHQLLQTYNPEDYYMPYRKCLQKYTHKCITCGRLAFAPICDICIAWKNSHSMVRLIVSTWR